MRRKRSNVRGVAVPMVLFVIMIVLILGIAISTTGAHNIRTASQFNYSTRAQYAAETGLSVALNQIKNEPGWNGHVNNNPEQSLTYSSVPMPEGVSGSSTMDFYTARVYNNLGSSSAVTSSEADGSVSIPPKAVLVVSEGLVRTGEQTLAVRRVGAVLTSRSPFAYAMFGDRRADLGNLNIAAYNSDAWKQEGSMRIFPMMADIGSNGSEYNPFDPDKVIITTVITGQGALNVDGNVMLNSEVPLSAVDWKVANGITGEVMSAPKFDLKEVEIPEGLSNGTIQTRSISITEIQNNGRPRTSTENVNWLEPGYKYGEVNMRSRSKTVLNGPGVYVLNGADVGASSTVVVREDPSNPITIQNPVKIYVTGDIKGSGSGSLGVSFMDLNGNVVHENTPGFVAEPCKVQVFATKDADLVSFRGNPAGSFLFYGPYTNFDIRGNVDFYGSVIAESLSIKGNANAIYYDLKAREIQTDYDILSVVSWLKL